MQKFLRTLMLLALLLPFASQAQNTLTVADGTATNTYVPIHGSYVDDFTRCQIIYPASELEASALAYGMTGGTISSLTFYLSSPATASWGDAYFEVKMMEVTATTLSGFVDVTNATTVYTGALDGTSSPMTITLTTPYTYQGGNLLLEIGNTVEGTWKSATFLGVSATGASWQGYSGTSFAAITGSAKNFMPKTTFTFTGGTEITCRPVSNVAVDATATTANSLTLTWTDALNTGATYTVYNGDAVVATGITANTYTVTGLDANTEYTLGVVANCSATDAAAMMTVTGRTTCAATQPLPYVEEFNGYSGFQSNPYTGPSIMPRCWDYYSNGTNTAETTTNAYYGGVTQYSSTYSYACMVANDPYLYMPIQITGSAVTSATYIGYETARGNTKYAVLPAFATALSGLQISFDYKMSSAYSATGTATTLELGYVTDDDTANFVTMQSYQAASSIQHVTELNLSGLAAAAPAGARLAFKFSGVHNGTYSSSYANVACGIDNILVEPLPSCSRVTDLTVAATTSSSITLNWADATNSGATYSVYIATPTDTTLEEDGITGTTFTVTGLEANTAYTFAVEANCSATESAARTLVSGRTQCAPEELPFTETFDATLASDPCWRGASNITADSVFNGGVLNLVAPAWTYTSSTRDGLDGGHYYKNVFGTSCKHWIITPAIDLSEATSAQLAFDVAFTAYSNTGVATGTMEDDKFIVLVSTDAGNTWLSANTFTWQVTGGDYPLSSIISASYVPQVINLNAYLGDTIKIAFYAESTVTGNGDNDLHIDNIVVSEVPSCPGVMGLTLDSVMSTTAYISWNNSEATGFEVEVRQGDVVFDDATISIENDTTATISDLEIDSTYQIYVRAICGSDYGMWVNNPLNLHIGYCTPNPTSRDGQGITNVAFGGMTNATHPSAAPYYGNYTAMAGSVPAGTTASVEITYSTGTSTVYSYGTIIWVDWDNSLTFDDDEIVYTGMSEQVTTGVPQVLTATFVVPATMEEGNYRMRIVGADSYFDSYVTGGTGNHDPCFTSTYAVAEDYTLTVTEAPSCTQPSGLTVTDITPESAVLRWTGVAASYHVYTVDEEGDTVLYETTAEDTLLIEDLDAQTSYIFGVASVCGLDESDTSFVTFTTACGAKAIPFTEDFENGIDCWSLVACAASTGIYTDASYVYSGTQCFKFAYNTNPPQYLISPELSNTDDGVSVSFMYRVGSETWTESFKLGYSTTTDDITAFTWGPEQTGLSNLTYEAYSEVMPAGTKYVAIQYTANDKLALYIDSMVFALPPSCLPVAGLTVDSANATSVFLSWTGSATSYTVYDMADSSVVDANVTDTEYEVTGLTAATGYVFGVAANCGSEMSDTVIIAARTACAAFAIPFTENFEATSASFPCWTVISEVTSTGLNSGLFLFYYTDEPPQYLISPELSGTAGIDLEVSFDYAIYNATYLESFQVGYSTTTNDVTAFTWSPEVTATNAYDDDGFLRYSVIYSNITDDIKYVAIKCTSNDRWALLLDSVVISEAPTCLPVTNLAVDTTSITATSVTISWTGTAASYDVFNGSEFVTNTTSTTYTLTGLTAAMNYTIGVMARCSAEDSSYLATVVVATACGVISTFPYTQDFADFPACWTTIDADGDGNNWSIVSGAIHSASYDNNYGVLYPDNWLITPQFQLATGTNYEVTWNADPQDASYPAEHYALYVSTTTPDTANFVLVQEWTLTSAGHVPVVDLSAYSGNIYLAFRHWDCYDQFRIAIDNFQVRAQAAANQVTVTLTQNNPMYGSVAGGGVYDIGDSVTVTATPASSYQFSKWIDTLGTIVSTENPYTFQAVTNVTLQAVFISASAETYTITVDVNDSTMGTATGSGTYAAGDAVTMTATAFTGFHFVNWTQNGNELSTSNPFTMTATSNTAAYPIVANFAADSTVVPPTPVADSLVVNMSVNNATMGTTVPAPGTHIYHIGDTVTAAAVPASGYHLDKWIITMSYMGQTVYGDTLIAIPDPFWLFAEEDVMVMDSMMVGYTFDVEAVFAVGDPLPMNDSVTLITSVNDATMGSIIPAPGTHVYGTDEYVVWSITPNDGYYLANVHFSLAHAMYGVLEDTIVDGAEFLAEMGDTIFFEEMENFYITFEAIFAPQGVQPVYHNVTVRVNDPTMGHVDGIPTTPVLDGATVTLTAVANDGFRFVSWSNGLTTAAINITVTSDTLLVAVFDTMPANPQYYTVTVTYDRTRGNVTLTPDQEQYLEGSSVGLVANAYDRYEFVAWLDENGDTLGTNTAYTITNIQSNRALTAVFVEKQGIDRVDMANVNVFSVEDVIYVRGAEGMNVYLFDVNGRVLNHTANAAESVEFRVAHTGVYLVKVGEAAAKRVVVLR